MIGYHSDTMTVVSIVSSPRKGGFGDRIASAMEEGVGSAGKEVERFNLNELKVIRQCQNCEACKNNGGVCVIKDDIAPVIDAIRDADGIILDTSIQFNEMNGLFKVVFDRLYCFLDMNATTIMDKGKKVAVIVTASADADSAERVSKNLEDVMCQHFFCEAVGRIAYCTWMMPKEMPIDDAVLDEARSIGARF